MLNEQQTKFYKKTQQDHKLLVLIFSLEKFESQIGQRELFKLMAQHCPLVKNSRRELRNLNQLIFDLWLLKESDKNIRQEEFRKEDLKRIIMAGLDAERMAFDEKRWQKAYEEYYQLITKQMYERIHNDEKAWERTQKLYFDFIETLKNQIERLIAALLEVKAKLEQKIVEYEQEIHRIRQEVPERLVALYAALPPLGQHEGLRQQIFDVVEKFRQDPNASFQELLHDVVAVREKLLPALNQEGSPYDSRVVDVFNAGAREAEVEIGRGINFEIAVQECRKKVVAIIEGVKELEKRQSAISREQEAPTYDHERVSSMVTALRVQDESLEQAKAMVATREGGVDMDMSYGLAAENRDFDVSRKVEKQKAKDKFDADANDDEEPAMMDEPVSNNKPVI